jgi:hypothetical protein
MQAFQVIPTGQTQTGSQSGSTNQNSTQTQQGTNLVSGNPTAGLFSGLGAGTLASLPLLSQNMNWGQTAEQQQVYDPATDPNGDINQESYDPNLFTPDYGSNS